MAIGTASAVALLVAQTMVIRPYFDSLAQINTETGTVRGELNDASSLFQRQAALNKVWLAMQKGGLQSDASQAEIQAQQSVFDWAKNAKVSIYSLKREQSTEEGKFQVISFSVGAYGTTPQIAQLLFSLETASIPLRINEIRLQSQKEGTDNLNVSALSISTLCAKPEALDSGHDPARVASIGER